MTELEQLAALLARLPGVGKKSSMRMTYYLLKCEPEFSKSLGEKIKYLRSRVTQCQLCQNFSETEVCPICTDEKRDRNLLCVVEHPQDIANIENTHEYRGRYFVLHGLLAPLDGVGTKDLGFEKLGKLIETNNFGELVIATKTSMEGDATAMYISSRFRSERLKITRLASGLPVGGDIEFVDRLTLSKSFRYRNNIN